MQPFPSCLHSWEGPGWRVPAEWIGFVSTVPCFCCFSWEVLWFSICCVVVVHFSQGEGRVLWPEGWEKAQNSLQAPQFFLADRKCRVGWSLDNLQVAFQLEIPEKNGFLEWSSSRDSYHCRGLPTAGSHVLVQVTIAAYQWNNHAPECLLTSSDDFTAVPRAMLPWWQRWPSSANWFKLAGANFSLKPPN